MSETLNGTVIWWNRNKGYGIADVRQQNRQILLHKTQITNGRTRENTTEVYLRGGDSIEFETHRVNPNIAKNIQLAHSTPPCSPTSQSGATPPPRGKQLYDDSTDEEY